MGNLTKEYEIKMSDHKLRVRPNYDTYKNICGDVIFIDRNDDWSEDQITLSIDEAKKLMSIFQEIIDAVESEPMVGDIVTILDGELKGMTGKIFDIDTVATEKELVVLIDKTENHDKFYAYVDKDNVE